MPARQIVLLVFAVLMIGFSLVRWHRDSARQGAAQDRDYQEYVGKAVAGKASSFLPADGKALVLLAARTANGPAWISADQRAAGFVREMRRLRREAGVVEERIPLQPMASEADPSWDAQRFLDACERHRDAALVVSFIGEPRLTPGQMDAWRGRQDRPAVVVVNDLDLNSDLLLQKGVVQLAVVPRLERDASTFVPGENVLQSRFEWEYVMRSAEPGIR